MSERPVSPQTLEKWRNLKKVLESDRGRSTFQKYIKRRFPDETDCLYLVAIDFWEQFHSILKFNVNINTKLAKVKHLTEAVQCSDALVIERPVLERLHAVDSSTIDEVVEEVLQMITEDAGLEDMYQDFYKELYTKKDMG